MTRPAVQWSPIYVRDVGGGLVRLTKGVMFHFEPGVTEWQGEAWPKRPFAYYVKPSELGEYDSASIPPGLLESLAADKLESIAAATLHDHWVRVMVPRYGWPRALGDNLFRVVLEASDGVTMGQSRRMWLAVRLFTAVIGLSGQRGSSPRR